MLDVPRALDPDDALAQPTRARLFALLDELKRPASTAELADRLGLHPNGVRVHLERLMQAGLLARTLAHNGRGRPPDAWTIAPDARPAGEPPRAYRDLGRWLARAMRSGRVSVRGMETTGQEIGRELACETSQSGGSSLALMLAALGFEPSLRTGEHALLRFTLGNCPYRDAARENQTAVCALHKGLTQGLLEQLEPDASLIAFTPHDPEQAGCVIEVRASEALAGHMREEALTPAPAGSA